MAAQLRDELKRTLFEAGQAAARALMKHFGRLSRIDYKGDVDLITAADREAEEKAIARIRRSFPDHTILAEESALHKTGESEFRWIIDPLDGTTNFAHSLRVFAVSIGLERRGELLLGLALAPALDETYFAEKGRGARLNGKRIAVSRIDSLREALAATGFAYDRHKRADYYLKYVNAVMRRCQGIRRPGCAALDLCSVAAGRIDVYWEENLNPWDMAAGTLIVREAGGTVSNFSGAGFSLEGRQIIATNAILHRPFVSLIQEAMHKEPRS